MKERRKGQRRDGRWITENDFLVLQGIDVDEIVHCTSCHDDDDMGYGMSNAFIGDDEVAVCCRVANKFKTHIDERRTAKERRKDENSNESNC